MEKTNLLSIKKSSNKAPININQIPKEILLDPEINEAISILPSNYNFEIHKCIWQLRRHSARKVALQFPEGLLMYSCVIGDLLEKFCLVDVVVLGDVTYGACCIDDYTSIALGCDFMIHYGHSCLVPIDVTKIRVLYVFVDISFDILHLIKIIVDNFDSNAKLALLGTVQFISVVHQIKKSLTDDYSFSHLYIPQMRPLSPGEVLGCTSPKLTPLDTDAYIYIADGRFHLEAIMIANPTVPAYKYDPYSKVMSREYYEVDKMHQLRKNAIESASKAKKIGLIIGTLGRQSSRKVVEQLEQKLIEKGKEILILTISEISPQKLALFDNIDAWIQTSCPRLSIDWGFSYDKPLLSPYEANVMLEVIEWQSEYPMDFYSRNSLGPWTPNYSSSNSK